MSGLYLFARFVRRPPHRRCAGIRIALGAGGRQVLWPFVRQGLGTAIGGALVGLGVTAIVARLLDSLLYGVTSSDPLTLTGVACLLVGVAGFACYLPARRAARIDPLVALRID